ncbi:hypothetical protein [Campylobacter sp. RM12637]|uniref:hypothetical protein n=1 Tax=Campylobacter sp. RM12637 TaxID=2735734 RepID=UPI003014B5BE|nr:hypothetical protein [Campylobacter sp. RM12637]
MKSAVKSFFYGFSNMFGTGNIIKCTGIKSINENYNDFISKTQNVRKNIDAEYNEQVKKIRHQ